MIHEFGGKESAKAMITLAIKLNTRASEKLLLDFTGLPPSMLHHLLNELEREKTICHEDLGTLKLWRMCAAESDAQEFEGEK